MPNNIKLLRKWRGMSQWDLAEKARCSNTLVSQYESGKSPLTDKKIKQFAEALEVPENMICGEVLIIDRPWERLVSDPMLTTIVEDLLTKSSKQLSLFVHRIAEAKNMEANNA